MKNRLIALEWGEGDSPSFHNSEYSILLEHMR